MFFKLDTVKKWKQNTRTLVLRRIEDFHYNEGLTTETSVFYFLFLNGFQIKK